MKLHELRPAEGSTFARKRVGRGTGSGMGKTSTIINGAELNRFEDGTVITAQMLKEAGVISKIEKDGLKVLGRGELTKRLDVKAAKFSETAQKAIEAAGGTVEVV